MTVQIKKIGGSVAVVIPKALAREMQLVPGTPLDVSSSGGAIVMRRQRAAKRRRRPIEKIVKLMSPAAYRRRRRGMELGEDAPVGKEIW